MGSPSLLLIKKVLTVYQVLVKVCCDLLEFCVEARSVLLDQEGQSSCERLLTPNND